MFKLSIKLISVFALTLFFVFGCSEDNPVESDEHHFEAIGLYIVAGSDTVVKYVGGVVTGDITLKKGTLTELLSVRYITEDGEVGIPPSDEWTIGWIMADNAIAKVVAQGEEQEQYMFRIEGINEGTTSITILLNHNDHKDFESEKIPVIVAL